MQSRFSCSQTDIIRILLRNGAQVDARAREQQTPLHIASRLGNVDIVMLLLQHGAQVDAVTKDMYTALHIAAKEGQDEVKDLVAKKLMDHIDTVYLMQLFWIRHQEYFI
jgi:ankyrin repeat protein